MRIFASLILFSAALCAQDQGLGNGCSNSMLKGSYGFTVSGTKPLGPAVVEQFVGMGIAQFDGSGQFTQTGNNHASVTGDYSGDGSGAYSINADCSGTATLTLASAGVTLNLWIVVVDQGAEVRLVVKTPVTPAGPMPAANLTTAIARKVGRR
jgi:hypothetical protein